MDNSGLNSNHNRYTTDFISGESNFQFNNTNNTFNEEDNYKESKQNYNDQLDVLDKRNKVMVPKTYDLPLEKMYTATPGLFGQRHTPDYNNLKNRNSDKYDPVGDYFYKKGDKHFSSITRYTSNYISVDSRLRQKDPVYNKLDFIQLPKNPLCLTFKSNILTIKTNDLIKLEPNDKFSLIGLPSLSKKLKTTIDGFLEFTNGSQYVKVIYPHGLSFNNQVEAGYYDNSDLYIEISGINTSDYFINNIPTSTINGIQKLILVNPDTFDYSNDYFFIKLIRNFNGTYSNTYNQKVKLTFYYSYGIANNKINSQYPINFQYANGYLVVKSVKKNYINVELLKNASFDISGNGSTICFGGSNICIAKIDEIYKGNPLPTDYRISLDRTYNNIVMIRLVSSEFPVLNKLVYSCEDVNPQNNNIVVTNNKLYWQNLDDGEHIYSIEIDQGNYTMDRLIKIIEEKVAQVKRINILYGDREPPYNNIKIEYYEGNSEIKFTSFIEAPLGYKIGSPGIGPLTYLGSFSPAGTTATLFNIKVTQINHNLKVGDKIVLSGAIDTNSILAQDINGEQYVHSIIDSNNYTFRLKNINLIGNPAVTGGGISIKVLLPNTFRLRFDNKDTLGDYFGFRKLGDSKSITNYSTIISNRDLYQNENLDNNLLCQMTDASNNKMFTVKSLDIGNDNYILMTCNSLSLPNNTINQMISYSKVKNIFAKIQIRNDSSIIDNIIFNSFIQSPMYMHSPIQELKELYFKFYDKHGNEMKYSDFDHSFTLEIVCISEIPERTNFSAKYPKIN